MKLNKVTTILTLVFSLILFSSPLEAHCDSMDGPVITEAKQAIATKDTSPVLKWVSKSQEKQLREVFSETLNVRQYSAKAAELADRYFFETLIRLHRETEGAPYTGLKPAGQIEPAIMKADAALESGRINPLAKKIGNAMEKEIKMRHENAMDKQAHASESTEAGREFIEAYVSYVHFVEAAHNLMSGNHAGHGEDNH